MLITSGGRLCARFGQIGRAAQSATQDSAENISIRLSIGILRSTGGIVASLLLITEEKYADPLFIIWVSRLAERWAARLSTRLTAAVLPGGI